uniref:uncharacterized protein LOC120330026 isoform X2 n=1 Tax=Styela clava TaxID=7725 RepID=UPI00193A47BC|nr:uncharacterized protein LOC120330026 isoform X2 [Styela clava]
MDPSHNRTPPHIPQDGDSESQNPGPSAIQPTGEIEDIAHTAEDADGRTPREVLTSETNKKQKQREMKNDDEGVIEDVDHTDEYTDGKAPPELPKSETNGKQKQKLEKEKPQKRKSNASEDGGSQKKMIKEEYTEFELFAANERVRNLMRQRKYEKALKDLIILKSHYGTNQHVETQLNIAECSAWTLKAKAKVRDAIKDVETTIKNSMGTKMEVIKKMAEDASEGKDKTMTVRAIIYYRICSILCKEKDRNKVFPELIKAITELPIPPALKRSDNKATQKGKTGEKKGGKNTKPDDMAKDFIIPSLEEILESLTKAGSTNTTETSVHSESDERILERILAIANAQYSIALYEVEHGFTDFALKRIEVAMSKLTTKYSKHIVYAELLFLEGKALALKEKLTEARKKFKKAINYANKVDCKEKSSLLRKIIKEQEKLDKSKKK